MKEKNQKIDQATRDAFSFYKGLIAALAGNSEVYKGTAQDAAKLPKLAQQIMEEYVTTIEEPAKP